MTGATANGDEYSHELSNLDQGYAGLIAHIDSLVERYRGDTRSQTAIVDELAQAIYAEAADGIPAIGLALLIHRET